MLGVEALKVLNLKEMKPLPPTALNSMKCPSEWTKSTKKGKQRRFQVRVAQMGAAGNLQPVPTRMG